MLQEVIALFRQRDAVMFVIMAFLCVGWVVVFERLIMLQLVYRLNFVTFIKTIKKMLLAGDFERARKYCVASSKTGLPYISLKAIETYEADAFRVRGVLQEESLLFFPKIRRRLSQLPGLATGVVLLGSLAAVNGIWHSFHLAEAMDYSIKSAVFSQGLSQALTPLSFSLLAALLLLVPYNLLESIATRLENDVEHGLVVVTHLLVPDTAPSAFYGGGAGVAVVSHHHGDSQAGGTHQHNDSGSSHGADSHATDAALAANDHKPSHGSKGKDHDLDSERSEPTLDEEEII